MFAGRGFGFEEKMKNASLGRWISHPGVKIENSKEFFTLLKEYRSAVSLIKSVEASGSLNVWVEVGYYEACKRKNYIESRDQVLSIKNSQVRKTVSFLELSEHHQPITLNDILSPTLSFISELFHK